MPSAISRASARWQARRRRLAVGGGPAGTRLDADFDVFASSAIAWPSSVRSIRPLSRMFGEQVGARLLAEPLLDFGQQLAEPRAEQFEVGDDLVLDVLVAGSSLNSSCFTFSSSSITAACSSSHAWCVVSASMTSTFASGWRTFRLAALRALRPSDEISRTRFMRSERASSIDGGVAGGIVAEVDAFARRDRSDALRSRACKHACEVLPQRLGEERHERGDELGRRQRHS